LIGGIAATSGYGSAGDGCVRYLGKGHAIARTRASVSRAAGKNGRPTEIARCSFQGERHQAIDPSLRLAFHFSGEAPGAAGSLAATPKRQSESFWPQSAARDSVGHQQGSRPLLGPAGVFDPTGQATGTMVIIQEFE
jgi:hypothetical protein